MSVKFKFQPRILPAVLASIWKDPRAFLRAVQSQVLSNTPKCHVWSGRQYSPQKATEKKGTGNSELIFRIFFWTHLQTAPSQGDSPGHLLQPIVSILKKNTTIVCRSEWDYCKKKVVWLAQNTKCYVYIIKLHILHIYIVYYQDVYR